MEQKRRAQLQLDREIVELRAMLRETERQLSSIRRTLSYRLGAVIVDARTLKGLIKLPKALFNLWRAQRDRRLESGARAQRPSDSLRYVEKTREVLRRDGFEAAMAYLAGLPDRQKRERARAMLEIAADLRVTEPEKAGQLGVAAAQLFAAEGRLRTLIFELYEDGLVRLPASILCHADPGLFASAAQTARSEAIKADAMELDTPLSLPPRAEGMTSGTALAIVTPRSLPSHAEAATYRVAAIAGAAVESGLKAVAITEPGYRYPAKGDGNPRRIVASDGGEVVHLPKVIAPATAVQEWVEETAAALGAQFASEDVGAVHIVASFPLALAAATAARARGLPFTLDIGALPMAGGTGGAASERSAAAWSRLATVARAADRVIVRSRSIADVFARKIPGVPTDFVPDVLPASFAKAGKASQRDIRRELGISDDRPLLGVMMDNYLGDEVLHIVRAMPAVRERVPNAVMVVFGPGRFGQSIRREAAVMGLGDAVLVPDGFARQRLAQYVSTFAAMAFPTVESDAPGLSVPFELQVALALDTPVILGECDWGNEWCQPGHRVALARCGDLSSYAQAIADTLMDTVPRS